MRDRRGRVHYLISVGALVVTRSLALLGSFVVVVLLASVFGATSETDAYFIARLIPIVIFAPLGIAFNLSFIPIYSRVRSEQGDQAAAIVAGEFLKMTLVAALLVTLVYVALAGWIVALLAPGFPPEAHSAAVLMTRIMALAIVLISLHGLFDTVLNADRRFVTSALSSLWPPVGAGVGVVLLGPLWGVVGLALGVLAGFALQAATVLPLVPRYIQWRGASFLPRDPAVGEALRDLALTVAVLVVGQAHMAVDRFFASLLEEGAVSALSLGVQFIGLVPFLVAMPIYKVIYPELVALVAAERKDQLRKLLSGSLLVVGFASLPVAAALALFSEPVTGLLFDYGRFSDTAAAQTAQVIFYQALGLPAAVGMILFFYYLLLVRQGALFLKISLVTLVINALLDWPLIMVLGIGGIPLGTTIIKTVLIAYLMVRVGQFLDGPILADLAAPLGKVAVAAALAAAAMCGAGRLLHGLITAPHPFHQIAALAAATALGGTVYLAANWMLRNEHLWHLLSGLRKRETIA